MPPDKFSKSAPKVLFITFEYREVVVGGIGRVVNGLVDELSGKLAFNVFVFRNKNHTSNISGVLFDELGRTKASYRRDIAEVISEIVEKHEFNIVHFMNPGYIASRTIDKLQSKKIDVKLVCSCHSLARDGLHIRNLEQAEVDLEDYVLKRIDYIHISNKSSMRCLESKYPEIVRSKPFTIIPNGIESRERIADLVALKNCENELRHSLQLASNLVVLCMSRWSHGKGLELLLEAVPRVVEKHPNIRFIIAGRKTTSWENDVQSYVDKIDTLAKELTPWVIPMGWVNGIQRDALMGIADIYVMPSEAECFPYSILEPMAAKIPIVSSRLPCVEEILEDDRECLMYSTRNLEELAVRISTMASNKTYRSDIASRAYEKVRDELNWSKVANMYINFYAKINQ